MKPRAVYSLFKKTISLRRLFCSAAVIRRRSWDFDGGDSSPVYQHTLKFQKPSTIKYINQPLNSASFIGRIADPLSTFNTRNGSLGVHTSLLVDSSTYRSYSMHVKLKMWNEMGELAMEHLKLNDFVYVWGQLISYTKLRDKDDVGRIFYELKVKDINFVTPLDQDPASTPSKKVELADEDWKDKYRMKLHLWQVFFSNPIEWRDLRKCKKNPRQPDFKHKDTGEALWLAHNDPPWIQRQLQLLDSRMGGLNFERQRNSSSMVSDFGKYI